MAKSQFHWSWSRFTEVGHEWLDPRSLCCWLCEDEPITSCSGTQSLNKPCFSSSPEQNKGQKDGMYKGEREKNQTNQPCSHHRGQNSAVANLLKPFSAAASYPKDSTGKGRGKIQTQHLKPKPRSRHQHLGCSSSADLLPHCSPGVAEAEVRKVPAGIGERLFPILPHCAKGRLPAAPPGIWAVLARPPAPSASQPLPSRSLLTHTRLCPRLGSLLRLPCAAGTASSKPGCKSLGLLWGTGSPAQR